jgi:uncharacterized protein YhfF
MRPLPSLQRIATTLAERGAACPAGRMRADRIGDGPVQIDALLAAIRSGGARGFTGLQWSLDATARPRPAPGDVSILLGHDNEPMLMTRLTGVDTMPFLGVDADFAMTCGYASLSHWRAAHWARFARECARMGRYASTDMPVVCCRFELLRDLAAPAVEAAASR